MIAVDEPSSGGAAGTGGHAERAGRQVRPLGRVDRPADDPPRPRIQDDAAFGNVWLADLGVGPTPG